MRVFGVFLMPLWCHWLVTFVSFVPMSLLINGVIGSDIGVNGTTVTNPNTRNVYVRCTFLSMMFLWINVCCIIVMLGYTS